MNRSVMKMRLLPRDSKNTPDVTPKARQQGVFCFKNLLLGIAVHRIEKMHQCGGTGSSIAICFGGAGTRS